MSSSSDDDCYGNIAKKLESLKSRQCTEKTVQHAERAVTVECVDSSLDSQNAIQDDSVINLLEEVPEVPAPLVLDTHAARRGRGRLRKSCSLSASGVARQSLRRGCRKKTAVPTPLPHPETAVNVAVETASAIPSTLPPMEPNRIPQRSGRPARGGQGGRVRSRGSSRRSFRQQLQAAIIDSVVYSVGNTHDYPDTAENIPIFGSNCTQKPKAVDIIDLSSSTIDDDYDENEELSVKVCWQQTEYIKFNIRKFQKLTHIFEFFSAREGVSTDRLLFTLRGRILRADDTPDSINYSTAHFIDGGVVTTSVKNIAGANNKENTDTGILIKFQCQNTKKPFETHIQPTQKLRRAMVKCAEHLEVPYSRLRFLLDGDPLSASSTPIDHALDSGDTIDVKIID